MAGREREKKARESREERESLRERLCRRLDVPPDLLPGEGLLELRGRNALTVRGGGKILTYTPEEIRIGLKRGCLAVRGRGLLCISYHPDAVEIEGRIRSLSFEEV